MVEKFEKIGLDYIFKNLNLVTFLGKNRIKNLKFNSSAEELKIEYDNIELTTIFVENNKKSLEEIKRRLLSIKDISNVIYRLKEGYILDDLDFFDIKIFALETQRIYDEINESLFFTSPKNLEKVVSILDPENMKIPSFYIYSLYSIELGQIRDEIKKKKEKVIDDNQGEIEKLYEQEMKIEDKIRKELSDKLIKHSESLLYSLDKIGYLDLLLAKVELNEKLSLVRPILGEKNRYKKIFNPKVMASMTEKGKKYQKIDVEIEEKITVITGANMSGKTLILKTIALCQYLCQFGFFVPSDWAEIKLVDRVFLMVGDSQSIDSGLSSFASEMLTLNEIILNVKSGEKPLILIDELGRTTNPKEGRAIVRSVIDFFKDKELKAIITTHYDGIGRDIARMRVKGLNKNDIPENISEKNIEFYIDYSLIEDENGKVPEEGLTVAKLLKIDEDIINKAYIYLYKTEEQND